MNLRVCPDTAPSSLFLSPQNNGFQKPAAGGDWSDLVTSDTGNSDLTHAQIFPPVNEDVNQLVNRLNTIGDQNE